MHTYTATTAIGRRRIALTFLAANSFRAYCIANSILETDYKNIDTKTIKIKIRREMLR